MYKGRVYVIGCVGVETYLQQAQASSSQQLDSKEIIQLRLRLATSEEHIRRMNFQFQNFQSFILYYLPAP